MINAHVLAPREQHLGQSDCGADAAANAGVFEAATYNSAYDRACRAAFGYRGCVLAFLAVSFDRALFIGDGMIDRSRLVFKSSRQVHGISAGENHGVEMKQHLGAALDTAGASY